MIRQTSEAQPSGMWSGVPPIDTSQNCDLCSSSEDVDRTQEKVPGGRCITIPHDYVQANLCKYCGKEGWQIVGVNLMGKALYFNSLSHRTRHATRE